MTEKSDREIVVVGCVNLDICGKAAAALIPHDSNPGSVQLSLGGVGKNVAHNLSLLGQNVTMLTAIGGDYYAGLALEECQRAGIGLDHARRVPEGKTSLYLAIAGPEGDMALAVCDESLSRAITPDYLERNLELLNRAAAVVLEANLTPQAIEYLAAHCTAPLFADPVSVRKAERLSGALGALRLLKPNLLEAQLLSGVQIRGPEDLSRAADALLEKGVRQVCISLGADGLYCADATARVQLPCFPTALKNATGGGDALMAALVYGYLRHFSLYETACFALAAASIAVEGERTVNPALSCQAVLRRMADFNKIYQEERT